jgi:hypothetical protein
VTVRGSVVRYDDGGAIEGVLVSFELETGGGETVATTGVGGGYAKELPSPGSYAIRVAGIVAGTAVARRSVVRGDLLIDESGCRARYGVVLDARTSEPVAGALATLADVTKVTDGAGWYRIDLGCAPSVNFSTAFLSVAHPAYRPFQQVVGRGVASVLRLDAVLAPR